MIKNKFQLIIFLQLFFFTLQSQDSYLPFDELDFILKDTIVNNNNWPECERITNFRQVKDQVLWDNIPSENLSFELLISSNSDEKSKENIYVFDNKFDLKNIALRQYDKIKLRTRCHDSDSDLIIVGVWEELKVFASPTNPCDDIFTSVSSETNIFWEY